jgi:hypothetical protein
MAVVFYRKVSSGSSCRVVHASFMIRETTLETVALAVCTFKIVAGASKGD